MGRRWEWAKKWKPYRSKLEHDVAAMLKELGIGFRYESETIAYRTKVVRGVCGSCGANEAYQQRQYTPDFVIEGSPTTYLEVKGNFTGSDRAKMLAVKKDNPELNIRMIFGQDNKLRKTNDASRYSDWCRKHGFDFWVYGRGDDSHVLSLLGAPNESAEDDNGQVRVRKSARKASKRVRQANRG